MTEAEIIQMHKDQEKYNTTGFGRWSWFAMLEDLAKGDITKFAEIDRIPYLTCLSLLAYWKEKRKEEERLQKLSKNKI